MSNSQTDEAVAAIAIVGMSGRFPGARDLNEFWKNLCNGVESISWFSDEELLNSGVSPDVLSAPNYVRAGTVIDGIELFDASFFGFSPREAEIMDPQYRFFIECAWEALEHAAYNPDSFDGIIGVFGGMGMNSYMLNNLLSNPELVESEGNLQLRILNDKDFLASLTAYKLNLRGPSLTVQTACSTSLIAVSLACQSLLNYQCDIALAGGVAISSQQRLGYLAQEGVYSPDGHCRAFDAKAAGTVGGQGVGIVALKRLDDAIADGDYIHAVITGSATNNDGALKAGYTAPSIDGQSNVVAMAQALAGIAPETITYIETHGTATPLGDPIEVAALTQVFRAGTNKKSFCALGSVKTNIGHLDAAAGIASLLKTVLALKHKQIPPTLHFNSPNPHIDFERSPFYVNSALTEWKTGAHPRRAGVSSFSVGGVNAHLIVEEAVERVTSSAPKPRQLILLSAQSDAALEASTDNLVSFLKQNQDANITDIAYTLQVGRKAFGHRRMLVSGSLDDALTALESRDPKRVLNSTEPSAERPVAFLFPGLGNHYVNMGRDLYEEVPSYREQFDLCAEKLRAHLEYDIRDVVYPKESRPEPPKGLDLRRMVRPEPAAEADKRLNQTVAAQTVMFIVEYALAKTWIHMGISPQALMGYSIGEYVAACLAGIFSLDDSLRLVVERAQMIEGLEEGGMLAVPLSVEDVTALSMKGLSVAAINGPSLTILSGPVSAIDDVESRLARSGVATRRLHTTHAFHSRMMEPIRSEFERLVRSFRPGKPEIGILSSLTGSWLTRQQATDPAYWAAQMCETVRFSDAVKLLWNADDRVMLEIGPGQTLGAWALQHPASAGASRGVVISTLRHSYDRQHDFEFFLNSLGRLWLAGLDVKWEGLYEGERRLRLPLPTYPFQRKRFWIEPRRGDAENRNASGP